jgi:hypothetical protein
VRQASNLGRLILDPVSDVRFIGAFLWASDARPQAVDESDTTDRLVKEARVS